MKTLTIRNFGPIANCEIDVKNINVIIGRQASGKSTIAKCLYYFIVLKDELDNLTYESHHPGIMADGKGVSLYDKFRNRMKSLFLETFGFDTSMLKPDMCIRMALPQKPCWRAWQGAQSSAEDAGRCKHQTVRYG